MKILLLTAIFLSISLYAKPLKVDVSANSAVLINAETGAVLYDKQAQTAAYPASITKIATALFILEKKAHMLDEIATATSDDVGIVMAHAKRANITKYPAYRLEHDGTHANIKIGEQFLVRNLLYALLLVSANDAANVLARHISGSVPKFMEELNAFLKEKGIAGTSLCNPHGLHYPNHYSTAYDMARMASMGLKIPLFREIVKTTRCKRPKTNKQEEGVWLQGNRLLRKGDFYYPKAIGVKTGFYSIAGHTLVAAAEHEGRILVAAVLGCSTLARKFEDAIALFETAFAEKKLSRTLFTKQYDLFSNEVKGAKVPVEASLAEDLKIAYYPAEEPQFKALLYWQDLKLPIAKDQCVGEIRLVTAEGDVLKSGMLYAQREIPKTFWYNVRDAWQSLAALPMKKIILVLIAFGLALAAALHYRYHNRSKTAMKSASDSSSGRA